MITRKSDSDDDAPVGECREPENIWIITLFVSNNFPEILGISAESSKETHKAKFCTQKSSFVERAFSP